MSSNSLKAFGKSIVIIVWFYAVSILVSNMVALCSRNPQQFILMHSNLLNILCYIIIFMGLYLLDKSKKQFIEELKPKSIGEEIKEIVTFIGMGVGTYLVAIIIAQLLFRFFPEYEQINQSFTQYEPVLRFIGMVLLPPLVEEYLFRYKIQSILKGSFGRGIAILGQALLFGMLHYYVLQKIYAAVIGLIFGFVKEKKGIKATIWMHMTVNFIGWLIGSLVN